MARVQTRLCHRTDSEPQASRAHPAVFISVIRPSYAPLSISTPLLLSSSRRSVPYVTFQRRDLELDWTLEPRTVQPCLPIVTVTRRGVANSPSPLSPARSRLITRYFRAGIKSTETASDGFSHAWETANREILNRSFWKRNYLN